MKRFFHLLSSNTFIKGGFLLTFSNFIVGFLNYLFNIFSGRALGPEGYSEIATLFSYLILMTFPVGVMNALLINKIGQKEDTESYTAALQQWISTKIKKWCYLVVIPLIAIPFLPQLTNLSLLTSTTLVVLILSALAGGWYNSILQGRHLFMTVSVISVIAAVIKLSGSVIALFLFKSLTIVLLLLVISALASIVISHIMIMKKRKKVPPQSEINKRLLHILKDKQFWFTLLVTASTLILGNLDIIFAKKMFSAEDAGLYGAWSLYAKIILYVFGPLLSIGYIFFSNKKQERYHQYIVTISIIGLIGISYIMFLIYDRNPVLLIRLIFGDKFMVLLPYIDWAALFGSAYLILMFFSNYYLAKGHKAVLILPLTIPIYIGAIFIWVSNISEMMIVNIGYSVGLVILLLIYYFSQRIKTLFI